MKSNYTTGVVAALAGTKEYTNALVLSKAGIFNKYNATKIVVTKPTVTIVFVGVIPQTLLELSFMIIKIIFALSK